MAARTVLRDPDRHGSVSATFKIRGIHVHVQQSIHCSLCSVRNTLLTFYHLRHNYSTVLRDLDLRHPIQKNVSPALVSALVNVGQSLHFIFMLSLTHSAVVPK
jgi:hypothetical protein